MKIAVVGAGYTGLACAWHLLHSPFRPRGFELTLFDEKGVGGGASGIAAGLLHPFVGRFARRNWKGLEGMQATQNLLNHSAAALGHPVASSSGLLRIALTDEQEKNFRTCARENKEVEWWEKERCRESVPLLAECRGGIFITNGQTVFSNDYLQGLWKSCELQKAEFSKMPIEHLSTLKEFDRIVVAAGFGTLGIKELADLPITLVKGQLLELAWPESLVRLPFPVNSQAYALMNRDNKSCIVGATFEKNKESPLADIEFAKQEIFPKLSFLPDLQSAQVLGCRSHFRVSTKDHLPLMERINPKTWVLTGMGSKGLLYHALFAEELSQKVLFSH